MHPSRNTHTPEKYLAGLESNDASRLFYEGQKYTQTSFNKFLMGWNIYGYYQELRNFYPYTPAVTKAADLYVSDMTESVQTGLAISAASMYTSHHPDSLSTRWPAAATSCPFSASTVASSRPTEYLGSTLGPSSFPPLSWPPLLISSTSTMCLNSGLLTAGA